MVDFLLVNLIKEILVILIDLFWLQGHDNALSDGGYGSVPPSNTSKASLESTSGDNSSISNVSDPSVSGGPGTEKDKDLSRAVDKVIASEGGKDNSDVVQVSLSHLLHCFDLSYRIFTVFCL